MINNDHFKKTSSTSSASPAHALAPHPVLSPQISVLSHTSCPTAKTRRVDLIGATDATPPVPRGNKQPSRQSPPSQPHTQPPQTQKTNHQPRVPGAGPWAGKKHRELGHPPSSLTTRGHRILAQMKSSHQRLGFKVELS